MSEPPILTVMTALGQFSMAQLAEYGRAHPPTRDTCKWCRHPIVSTPWFAPSGTFHMVSGGWTHEDSEQLPCGREYPYRFAEPEEQHMSTVTVDYGDGMVTTWEMSKFMAIGVVADLEREHGEGHTQLRDTRNAFCGDDG